MSLLNLFNVVIQQMQRWRVIAFKMINIPTLQPTLNLDLDWKTTHLCRILLAWICWTAIVAWTNHCFIEQNRKETATQLSLVVVFSNGYKAGMLYFRAYVINVNRFTPNKTDLHNLCFFYVVVSLNKDIILSHDDII